MRRTVTVHADLVQWVRQVARAEGTSPDLVVARAVEEYRDRYTERRLREGYDEMAAHDRDLIREFEHVDRETPWPEYAE
jgi:hypothetical protein